MSTSDSPKRSEAETEEVATSIASLVPEDIASTNDKKNPEDVDLDPAASAGTKKDDVDGITPENGTDVAKEEGKHNTDDAVATENMQEEVTTQDSPNVSPEAAYLTTGPPPPGAFPPGAYPPPPYGFPGYGYPGYGGPPPPEGSPQQPYYPPPYYYPPPHSFGAAPPDSAAPEDSPTRKRKVEDGEDKVAEGEEQVGEAPPPPPASYYYPPPQGPEGYQGGPPPPGYPYPYQQPAYQWPPPTSSSPTNGEYQAPYESLLTREDKKRVKAKKSRKGRNLTTEIEKKERKNEQSRVRAAKLKARIAEIQKKPEDHRTDDERKVLKKFEERRHAKNRRSAERASENKAEIERIMAKPESKRTSAERKKLAVALKKKERKNEGDRIRRELLKANGIGIKDAKKVSVSVRGGTKRLRGDDVTVLTLPGVIHQQQHHQHHQQQQSYPPSYQTHISPDKSVNSGVMITEAV